MAEGQTTAKSCMVCGIDVSGKPRTKDNQGRYVCKDCFDKAKDTNRVLKYPPPPPGAKGANGIAAGSDAETDNSFLLGMGAKNAVAEMGTKPCPECGRALTSDSVVCVGCGFNSTTGKRMAVRVLKPVKEEGEKRAAGPKEPIWKNPHFAGIMTVVLFGVMAALQMKDPVFIKVFWFTALGFFLVTWWWARYAAIEEYGGMSAWLLFMLPLFPTYFVFLKQESSLLKWLWGARIIVPFLGLALNPDIFKALSGEGA